MAKVKCGLIQMGLKGDGSMDPLEIRDRMIEAHIPYIEDAAAQGVQVLCFQEVFTQPYFCPSQDRKWYGAAESIPDGHTTSLMREYAKKHNMVIVVPIYEEEMPGVYYNTAAVIDADGSFLGKYRKTHIPQVDPGFYEKFFFKPGDSGWPVFDTAYLKLGMREFGRLRRELASFVEAVRSGALFVQNGQRGRWIGDNKLCLAVLSDSRFRDPFPPAGRARATERSAAPACARHTRRRSMLSRSSASRPSCRRASSQRGPSRPRQSRSGQAEMNTPCAPPRSRSSITKTCRC